MILKNDPGVNCNAPEKEGIAMNKRNVCVLFGGVSPEHEVSLRSAECILSNIDREKNNVFPVGITKEGTWVYFPSEDYSLLPLDAWMNAPGCCPCALSPSRGDGLLLFRDGKTLQIPVDVVFPVLHGENGEDGSVQGLLQVAGIPCVGAGVAASATCMDKCMTKLIIDRTNVRQAKWFLLTREAFAQAPEAVISEIEADFAYPMFVKPAGTGSSVGVSKARNRQELFAAAELALRYDRKALVEEFINGHEIEVAVLGNANPVASVCGEIISGADFYDYDAKYLSDCSSTLIPATIADAQAQKTREAALTVYQAMGCRGMSRVDFFVTYDGGEVVFNEINTLPGFTSISMYPKMFEASGISCPELIEKLLELALSE